MEAFKDWKALDWSSRAPGDYLDRLVFDNLINPFFMQLCKVHHKWQSVSFSMPINWLTIVNSSGKENHIVVKRLNDWITLFVLLMLYSVASPCCLFLVVLLGIGTQGLYIFCALSESDWYIILFFFIFINLLPVIFYVQLKQIKLFLSMSEIKHFLYIQFMLYVKNKKNHKKYFPPFWFLARNQNKVINSD